MGATLRKGFKLKHKIFCDEYLKTLNAAEAARRAGFAEKTANIRGYELLKDKVIQGYLNDKLQETLSGQDDLIKARVISLWKQIAFAEVDIHEADPAVMRNVLKASELLAKYLGLLVEAPAINISDPENVNVIINTLTERHRAKQDEPEEKEVKQIE